MPLTEPDGRATFPHPALYHLPPEFADTLKVVCDSIPESDDEFLCFSLCISSCWFSQNPELTIPAMGTVVCNPQKRKCFGFCASFSAPFLRMPSKLYQPDLFLFQSHSLCKALIIAVNFMWFSVSCAKFT